MKKFLLSAALVWVGFTAQAQNCPALTALNEDFSNFTAGQTATFPQFCWAAIANGPMVYPDVTGENKFAQFYTSTSTGVAGYLVSPLISNFDGNHRLTFDATSARGVSVQAGYLTNPTDSASFVAVNQAQTLTATTAAITVNFPVVAGNLNIAFKFIGTAPHSTAQVDNIVWAEAPAATCAAVSEFNEGFSDYQTGQGESIDQFCWTAIAAGIPTGVVVYPDLVEGNKVAQFYNFMNTSIAGYLVSPEVNSFDGNHTLTFDAGSVASGTLQAGYLTNPTDATTFIAVGAVINLPATTTGITRQFPVLTSNAYIAFKFLIPNVPHQTAYVDNIKWQTTAGVNNNSKSIFAVYPNPSSDKNITLANATQQDGTVAIYSLAGAKVFEAKVSGAAQQLNLSALSAGMYVVRFTSGNAAATQKLILQ